MNVKCISNQLTYDRWPCFGIADFEVVGSMSDGMDPISDSPPFIIHHGSIQEHRFPYFGF